MAMEMEGLFTAQIQKLARTGDLAALNALLRQEEARAERDEKLIKHIKSAIAKVEHRQSNRQY